MVSVRDSTVEHPTRKGGEDGMEVAIFLNKSESRGELFFCKECTIQVEHESERLEYRFVVKYGKLVMEKVA